MKRKKNYEKEMEIWKGSRRVFQRESESTGYREACFEKLEKNGAV